MSRYHRHNPDCPPNYDYLYELECQREDYYHEQRINQKLNEEIAKEPLTVTPTYTPVNYQQALERNKAMKLAHETKTAGTSNNSPTQ